MLKPSDIAQRLPFLPAEPRPPLVLKDVDHDINGWEKAPCDDSPKEPAKRMSMPKEIPFFLRDDAHNINGW